MPRVARDEAKTGPIRGEASCTCHGTLWAEPAQRRSRLLTASRRLWTELARRRSKNLPSVMARCGSRPRRSGAGSTPIEALRAPAQRQSRTGRLLLPASVPSDGTGAAVHGRGDRTRIDRSQSFVQASWHVAVRGRSGGKPQVETPFQPSCHIANLWRLLALPLRLVGETAGGRLDSGGLAGTGRKLRCSRRRFGRPPRMRSKSRSSRHAGRRPERRVVGGLASVAARAPAG
jgi:hypothetical protein